MQMNTPTPFHGSVIKLTSDEVMRWERAFGFIGLEGHLLALDIWMADKPHLHPNWKAIVLKQLAAKNDEGKRNSAPPEGEFVAMIGF